jgi:hypothetical protein
VSPLYPVTGCGLPACRTCHPVPIPDPPPAESVLSLLVGVAGLALFLVAALYLLPLAWS